MKQKEDKYRMKKAFQTHELGSSRSGMMPNNDCLIQINLLYLTDDLRVI